MGCSSSLLAAEVMAEAPTLNATADYFGDYASKKGSPFWSVDGAAKSSPLKSEQGPGSEAKTPMMTIPQVLLQCKEKKGSKVALRIEAADKVALVDGKAPPALPLKEWKTWTWAQYYDEVYNAAKALVACGVEKHDAVNIFGFNSPEWHMGLLAAMFAGGKAAGIYPTDSAEQVQYKCFHSGASAFILEDEAKLKKVASQINKLPKLKVIVIWAAPAPEEGFIAREDGSKVKVLSWVDFVKMGADEANDALDARLATIEYTECCALIYTSGTTGNPKAVMVSHDNILFEASAILSCIPQIGNDKETSERVVSYLPLSHVAGMCVDIVAPVVITAWLDGWQECYFARAYDLKVGTISDRLRAVRPTMFLGVPRVWEKIAEKMKAVGASTTGLKKKIATWAKAKGLEHAKNMQLGGNGMYPSGYDRANKLVLSKVKAVLGLDQCKFGFTGAAPITTETLEYFGQLGIQINEVYGMSECTGGTTFSTDEAHQWGSCGWALPSCEVKCFIVDPDDVNKKTECALVDDIFNAPEEAQGEICFRGRHIMMGYLANPELGPEHVAEIEKKTREAIDEEGWLHSGDKGCISKQGMVKITGRYKELIIGSGGENIAPVPIEDGIKGVAGGISNIMMVGDKRKYNVALVTLKAVGATGELPGSDELDGEAVGVSADTKTISAARKDEAWAKYIQDAIAAINKTVTPPSRIQKFTILPADFSVETGELTPTLKLKRSVVEKKWLSTIESMYADDIPREKVYIEAKTE